MEIDYFTPEGPMCIVIEGPPGCGKTTLIRRIRAMTLPEYRDRLTFFTTNHPAAELEPE